MTARYPTTLFQPIEPTAELRQQYNALSLSDDEVRALRAHPNIRVALKNDRASDSPGEANDGMST